MNKKEMIWVRATQEEKQTWKEQAKKLGMNLSQYIRYLLTKQNG